MTSENHSSKVTPIPVIHTSFHVTSSNAAPLATLDEDFPSIVPPLRDTTIEDRYIEVKRLVKPVVSNVDQSYLTEYDSCTILSSADPSLSGYRRRTDRNGRTADDDDDDDTLSSKSDLIDDEHDEHVQISQMISQSFAIQPERHMNERIERSPSFYDNVIDGEQQSQSIYRRYPFETDIR